MTLACSFVSSWWTSCRARRSPGSPSPPVSWGQRAPSTPTGPQQHVSHHRVDTLSSSLRELPADGCCNKECHETIIGPFAWFVKTDWFNYYLIIKWLKKNHSTQIPYAVWLPVRLHMWNCLLPSPKFEIHDQRNTTNWMVWIVVCTGKYN